MILGRKHDFLHFFLESRLGVCSHSLFGPPDMRFAKRFRASFSGEFSQACLDYKGLKKLSKKLDGGEESALGSRKGIKT